METLLGSFIFAGLTVCVASVWRLGQRRRKLSRQHERELYAKLVDLYLQYFRLTTTIFEQRSDYDDTKHKYQQLAAQIIELLPKDRPLKYHDEIIGVTTGVGYNTAKEHRDAMSKLVDRLGQRLGHYDAAYKSTGFQEG